MARNSAEEEQREALLAKAEFCLATGVAPSEYDNLTDDEVDAFVEVYEKNTRQH